MEKLTIVVHEGQIRIPAEIQNALELTEGTRLTVSVERGGLLLRKEREAMTQEQAAQFLKRLRESLPPGSNLEDDLYRMRREEDAYALAKFG